MHIVLERVEVRIGFMKKESNSSQEKYPRISRGYGLEITWK
jgi:hypothetical protein